MKSFKILFYKSEKGELVHAKTLFRMAEDIADLVKHPPAEFYEMMREYQPVNGWAEMEDERATVFVIFAPRPEALKTYAEVEVEQFREWLGSVKPADFKKNAQS